MDIAIEKIIQIALEEFRGLVSANQAMGVEIEEIEELQPSGNYLVTLGYWAKTTKPKPSPSIIGEIGTLGKALTGDLVNPWRRKFKRVEIDPKKGKAVAIRMYEPPLGVS
jgi:hypothetical protein